MKNIFSAILCLGLTITLTAQDFDKNLATARSSYSSGNLEDARFAMQQMLNDIDVLVGKEMIKLLPAKLESLNANVTNDNVTANTGLAGVLVHRDYGTGEKTANLDLMSNSPLIGSLNAILSLPFVGNSGDGTQKVVKVQGYKGVLQKSVDTETNKTDYTLQIPIKNTLLTFVVNNTTEAEILKMANAIPVAEIVKLVQ
ncbi:MAG TPA: hypothetical protein VD884_02935 [Ohtaekwangia sp.]|nr:hypothetical protein [Ohtaekwangia sp.]